jgi:hypothetical protein
MNQLEQRMFAVEAEDPSVCESERRREPRVQNGRPVYVQPAEPGGEKFEELRTMKDFSRNGFYFLTDRESYQPGMQLHVIPAFGAINLEYLGEVVRVERLPFGEYGIAVRLLRVRNVTDKNRTATMSAFQAFALVDGTPAALSQNDSNGSRHSSE